MIGQLGRGLAVIMLITFLQSTKSQGRKISITMCMIFSYYFLHSTRCSYFYSGYLI